MRYPVFACPQDKLHQIVTEIKIPYWKCGHQHYLEILTLIKKPLSDYPFEYGPYPSPLSYVSFMDSILELRILSFVFIVI